MEVLKMKVVFLAKGKLHSEGGQESELAKQDESGYTSEWVNIRELGLDAGQLGSALGLLDWQKKTFPKVLEELEEAEKLLEQMSSGDPKIDAKVRVAVWDAKIKVKILVDSLSELRQPPSPEEPQSPLKAIQHLRTKTR
jgi:hypothetical protein